MTRAGIAAALAVALLASGCAQAAPTGPVPVATPIGSASPSVVAPSTAPPSIDPGPVVLVAFRELLASPTLSLDATIEGSRSVGTGAELAGTLEIAGPDSAEVITTTARDRTTTATVRLVDGTRYAITAGRWFEAEGPALARLVRGLGVDATYLGRETREGRTLHRLQVPPSAALAAELGVVRAPGTSAETGAEVWADDAGTPVTAEVHGRWTQVVDGREVPAAANLRLRFADVGAPNVIEPPDQVWQWNDDTRYGYRMAYPVGWAYQKGTATTADGYYGFAGEAVYATRGRTQGLSLRQLSGDLDRYLPQITGTRSPRVTLNRPAKLGPLAARRVEFTVTANGTTTHSILYLAVRGRFYYVLELQRTTPITDPDRELIAAFAGTFSTR
jgi:hypothetical protein